LRPNRKINPKITKKITKKGAPAMKTYRHIAAVAAMLSAAPALADMTPAEQQATLAAHNTERAMYPGVGALMWAPLLAQFAQQVGAVAC
jgi:uncharacterized protein YkwD